MDSRVIWQPRPTVLGVPRQGRLEKTGTVKDNHGAAAPLIATLLQIKEIESVMELVEARLLWL